MKYEVIVDASKKPTTGLGDHFFYIRTEDRLEFLCSKQLHTNKTRISSSSYISAKPVGVQKTLVKVIRSIWTVKRVYVNILNI